jgi:predicted DNA-binding transcriptional regulator AlpA
MSNLRVLRYGDLRTVKGITYSRSRIRDLVGKKLFPAPFKTGEGWNSWFEHEIDEYLLKCAETRGFTARHMTERASSARQKAR